MPNTYGTKALKKLLKKAKKMTPEEYEELFERAQQDVEEMKRKGTYQELIMDIQDIYYKQYFSSEE